MYIPKHFQFEHKHIAEFISKYPFASLVSVTKNSPVINFAPLLYDPKNHSLSGHLAINNPQLVCMQENPEITLIFNGPNGYISPNWYADKTQVPTWNYINVKVQGRVHLIHDSSAKLELVETLSNYHEQQINSDWKIEKVPDAKLKAMLTAITGFSIEVESWQGKAKLSQNKSTAERLNLVQGLKELSDVNSLDLAELMLDVD